MTLPNRGDYVPGDKKRAREFAQDKMAYGHHDAEAKPTGGSENSGDSDLEVVAGTTPKAWGHSPGIGDLRSDLCAMLASISPAQSKRAMQRVPEHSATSPVSGPESVAHRKALVLAARRRLEQDQCFEDVWGRVSVRGLLESKDTASDGNDAFEAALEQLPDVPVDPADLASDAKRTGLGAACLDGVLVDDDGSLRAKFERAAQQLYEWSKRRLALESSTSEQVPEPPRSTSPTEMVREGVMREGVVREDVVREGVVREDACGSPGMTPTLASYGFDLSSSGGAPKRRANLNKTAKELLRVWFEAHVHHPYPTEEEKEWLARQGGITLDQVNNWFINTRGRKWKPMLKRLMAEKQKGECKLLDDMVQRMTEPYHREA